MIFFYNLSNILLNYAVSLEVCAHMPFQKALGVESSYFHKHDRIKRQWITSQQILKWTTISPEYAEVCLSLVNVLYYSVHLSLSFVNIL